MSNLLDGPIAAFDIIVAAVVLVSAVMSLGRGLIREASSVISFIIGGIAAYFCVTHLSGPLNSVLPASWPRLTASVILVVVGFLSAYVLAAFVGGRLSRLIHASPEIGVVDRLAGAAFGVARGLLACVLFVLLMQQVLSEDASPTFVTRAFSYQYLDAAASWIRDTVPGFVDRAASSVAAPAASGDRPSP